MDELGSLFDEMEGGDEHREADGGDLEAVAQEFIPLNRRRASGSPPLSVAENERWAELREVLDYRFGSAPPPRSGSRRRALRIPTELKVRTARLGDARLHNFSEDGAFIECERPPLPETELDLELEPGDGQAPLRLCALVKWHRELPNMDGPAGVGVEFVDLEDGDFAILARLAETALVAALRSES